ncbi:hypothetical protein Mgra_00001861 [Meloidogyne graminicola]|uniref:Uncharacterized protein n=1 Tax=Meloidogyne graminicola TaxID=189291 RepID=A0A8S9ZZS8_9BILA|nr:hypothetical protein Mgra_00001861 [Meloidogyne graminicola]
MKILMQNQHFIKEIDISAKLVSSLDTQPQHFIPLIQLSFSTEERSFLFEFTPEEARNFLNHLNF